MRAASCALCHDSGPRRTQAAAPLVRVGICHDDEAVAVDARTMPDSTIGRDYSRVAAHHASARAVPFRDGAKNKQPAAATSPKDAAAPKQDCSPTWFGDTSPEVDPKTGGFTGKLVVKYNDAALKDPCVRECVELHESIHVRDLQPIVRQIHECDVVAGTDWTRKERCNELSNRILPAIRAKTECNAYRQSFTCLTLKLLDSASPCSRSPHREEVQKHRRYDSCHMRENCAEAGTPELGVPNA